MWLQLCSWKPVTCYQSCNLNLDKYPLQQLTWNNRTHALNSNYQKDVIVMWSLLLVLPVSIIAMSTHYVTNSSCWTAIEKILQQNSTIHFSCSRKLTSTCSTFVVQRLTGNGQLINWQLIALSNFIPGEIQI